LTDLRVRYDLLEQSFYPERMDLGGELELNLEMVEARNLLRTDSYKMMRSAIVFGICCV
jgi:hypothetical protein